MNSEPLPSGETERAEHVGNYYDDVIRSTERWVRTLAIALKRGDWERLGYPNRRAYIDAHSPPDRLQIGAALRRDMAELLRDEGDLNTREIGAALGVSHTTAKRDLEQNVPANEPDDAKHGVLITDQRDSLEQNVPNDGGAHAPPDPEDIAIPSDPEPDDSIAPYPEGMAETTLRAETAAAVARVMADDSDIEMRRLRLKVQFSRELKHALELQCLKPEAIADVVDADLRDDITHHFPLLRDWMDRVERALPRGLRVVS